MKRYRPYPEYKDTGVEWLGEVPAGWGCVRLRETVRACRNGVWGDSPVGDETDVACVRVADFDRVRFRVSAQQLTLRSVPGTQLNGRLLRQGDLLLEKSGGGEKQPVGAVVLYSGVENRAVCSNFIARMSASPDFDSVFLCYVHAHLYASRVNTRSIKQSIGIQNLDSAAYLDETVVAPPWPEQHAIADFLDRETARIDTLIEKKERLIELLQEERQALITQAVTKGLDPEVPMKDSGVEWLGEVPETWEVRRTKTVARLETGHTPSRQHPEYWENCTIPWFGLADVWQLRNGRQEYVAETNEKVSGLGLAHSAARLLPKGTVIVSRTASVGFSAIMAVDMATTQDFVNWICGPTVRPEYLLYVFRAMKDEYRRLTMGSTHQTIYMPDVKNFRTPLPPVHEQDAIVTHIRRATGKIDALTDKIRDAIKLLTEYRTTLISAAVTGKIDVRQEIAA